MQITCIYDAAVYRLANWVHPSVGTIAVSYGRFTIISNVNAGGTLMYYRLQVANPQPSDAGAYYCVFQTILAGVADSASITLVWKDPPQYQTPTGLVYRQYVQKSVLLECNVTNYLKIQWQRPFNIPVPISSSDSRIQMLGTSLYFSSLLSSDAGTYFCVTVNEITPVGASIEAALMVYEVPSVQVDSSSRVVNTSGHANFTCTARGTPQPTVIWTRENSNENLILSLSRITVSSNSYSASGSYYVVSTIDFPAVVSNDTGVYRCTASNQNGSSYVNVNLLLYGTPTAPTEVNVVTYNGSALYVTWRPPESNGSLSILSYSVYWQAVGQSVRSVTLSGIPPPTQYLIGGLDYLTNYSISVVANNARGKGYSSVPFVASTAASVPATPVNVTVKDLGSTSAVISWAIPDNGGSPILGTFVTYISQSSTLITVDILGPIAQCQLIGLPFNSSQTVSLRAFNAMGKGPTAVFFFSTTNVPEAPHNIVASVSQDVATVCWLSPTFGQPYLQYIVKVQAADSSLGDTASEYLYSAKQSSGTVCVKVISLKYNTCYNFTLFIENEHGRSVPAYSTGQACAYRDPEPVFNSSQSKAELVTVASGAVSGTIVLVLIIVVGMVLLITMVTRTRATKAGDHCLNSVNSSSSDTCKHSSSSSLAYKMEGHAPTSSTALLRETPFAYPAPTLVAEHPQHTDMLQMGYYSQDASCLGLVRTAMVPSVEEEEEEEEDGLTENPAFLQQNSEDKSSIGETWQTSLTPFLGESSSQASPPPMFTVVDSGNCTGEDDTMFVENNAYETHRFHSIPEPLDTEPRFFIATSEKGATREMVQLNISK